MTARNVFALVGNTIVEMPAGDAHQLSTGGTGVCASSFPDLLAKIGAQAALGYAPVQQGTGSGQNASNVIKVGWNGTDLLAQVDGTALGFLWRSSATAFSGGASGYLKLPNGFLLQWVSGAVSGDQAFSWPIAFPNAIWVAVPGIAASGATTTSGWTVFMDQITTSGIALRSRSEANGGAVGPASSSASPTVYAFAVGN